MSIHGIDKNRRVFNFLKWMFKIEFIIIISFLIIEFLIGLIPEKTKFLFKYNLSKKMPSTINECSYKEIYEILKENNYLSENEKKYIENSLENELKENYKYINKQCIENLKTLKIFYSTEMMPNSLELYNMDISKNIAGSFGDSFNRINIYGTTDFSSCDKEVLFHELNHAISKNTTTSFFEINILSETINELFAREYSNIVEENNAYGDYMIYSYAFAELFSEDTMRQFKFSDNISVLVDELLAIDNNFDEAFKLLNSIKFESSGIDYKNFHDSYNYFYEKKYGKEVTDNIGLLAYFYNSKIQSKEERNVLREYLQLNKSEDVIKVVPKGYYSKFYKEEHKNIKIEFIKNGKMQIIEIEDI